MKSSKSILLIAVGGLLVIVFTLAAVKIKQNEPIDPAETNMIILSAPPYDGIENILNESYDNQGYFIKDQTSDGRIMVTNIALQNEEEGFEDPEEYLKRFIIEKATDKAGITEFSYDEKISERLTYPAYVVCYEAGTGEDTVMGKGITFMGDAFHYYYGYSCQADDFEDNVSDFDSRLVRLELLDLDMEEE